MDWIKPTSNSREAIYQQAGDIRRVISNQAAADGLTVVATPEAGSFAKHTGLRRHMRGNSEIEGLDIDLPFVVRPATTDGERIEELLRKFETYAKASYPNTPRTITGSSVELRFRRVETELRSGADGRCQSVRLPASTQEGRLSASYVCHKAYGVCAEPHAARQNQLDDHRRKGRAAHIALIISCLPPGPPARFAPPPNNCWALARVAAPPPKPSRRSRSS